MAVSKKSTQENTQEVISSLQSAQQNNTNNGLNVSFKESINLLNKINKIIDDSTSKIQSFEKSTINIKKIESERERIKRKSLNLEAELSRINIAEKNTAENYIKKIQERKKEEEDLLKQAQLGLTVNTTRLNILESEIDALQNSLTVEQLRAIAILQSKDGLEERLDLINDELRLEKDIEKKLGSIGKILKITSKIGLGKNTFSRMVEEAREGVYTTKRWLTITGLLVGGLAAAVKLTSKVGDKLSSGLSKITGGSGPISSLLSPVSDLMKGIPVIGGLLGGVVDMFANLADFATESASAVKLFGRNLSLSESEAAKINNHFSNLAQNSGDLLFNSRKFRELQTEISGITGLNNILTDDQLKTQVQLKELGGIDLDTRKELLEVSRVSGLEQSKIVKTIMGQNSLINKTIGISFQWQKILKEASSLGGYLGLSFAKYPEKLTKSLTTVKAMGMELKQLDSIADSFLDFESSISKEFEAQLLTGKDINLTKAREAFLNNDLATAASEITKQVGNSSDFLKLNRIQAESLSSAFGMSRDQMAEMLKQQENFAKLGATDLKSYQQRTAELSKTIDGRKELVRVLGEEQAQTVMSQTATEKIANFIDKIKTSFADLLSQPAFTNFVNKIVDFISSPDKIKSFLGGITGFISMVIKAIAGVVNALDYITFGSIDNKIIDNLNNYANQVGSLSIGSLAASNTAGQKSATMTSGNTATTGKSNAAPIYIMVSVDPVTGKTVEKVVSQQYYETHVGQMNKR